MKQQLIRYETNQKIKRALVSQHLDLTLLFFFFRKNRFFTGRFNKTLMTMGVKMRKVEHDDTRPTLLKYFHTSSGSK